MTDRSWPLRCHLSAFWRRCLLAAPSLPTLEDFLLTDLCFEFLYLAASRLSIVLLSLQPSPPCIITACDVANVINDYFSRSTTDAESCEFLPELYNCTTLVTVFGKHGLVVTVES